MIYFLLFIYLFHFIGQYFISSELRYLKYFLPVFFLIPIFNYISQNFQKKEYYIVFIRFYLILIFYSFIILTFKGSFDTRNLANMLFIISPLLLIIYLYSKKDSYNISKVIDYLFFIYIVSYLLEVMSLHKSFSINAFLKSFEDALIYSEMQTESGLAFIFGLFVIHYFYDKKPIKLIFALLFTLLAFKRIVFLALIVIYIYIIIQKAKFMKVKFYGTIIIFSIFISSIALTYYLLQGSYNFLIKEYLGISADHLFMGRIGIYSAILPQISLFSLFSGLGVGTVDVLLIDYFNRATNLHSDIVKNLIEFGIPFFVVWVFLFVKYHTSNIYLTTFAIYLSILFITDNVFIYFNVMFIFYFLLIPYFNRGES